ncbi:hypothetical protein V8E53_005828 [Lactarius tabidus]
MDVHVGGLHGLWDTTGGRAARACRQRGSQVGRLVCAGAQWGASWGGVARSGGQSRARGVVLCGCARRRSTRVAGELAHAGLCAGAGRQVSVVIVVHARWCTHAASCTRGGAGVRGCAHEVAQMGGGTGCASVGGVHTAWLSAGHQSLCGGRCAPVPMNTQHDTKGGGLLTGGKCPNEDMCKRGGNAIGSHASTSRVPPRLDGGMKVLVFDGLWFWSERRKKFARPWEGQVPAPAQVQVPPFEPAAPCVNSISRTWVHFRSYLLAVALSTSFLARRQLARGSPTNDSSSADAQRDRSTAVRTESPTNFVQSSIRRQQDTTNATASNPAGFLI